MKKTGMFITIEGMDGSGKTTQIELMRQFFQDRQFEVIVTREPGGTKIGEKIRSIILDNSNSEMFYKTEMLLYASARAQIVYELISPAIENGKVVICDRFVDSTYVYQSYGRGIDFNTVKMINDVALSDMLPDITFFLDIHPRKSLERASRRGTADRIEKEEMEFHLRVYNGYKKLAAMYPERIKVVNASVSKNKVFENIESYLGLLLKDKS